MLKKLIMPFQVVLLKKRLCPGCTQPLDNITKKDLLRENRVILQCKCNRRYIHNLETDTFRRATFEEEKEFINKTKPAPVNKS